MCRTCAVLVVAGVWRKRSFSEIEARLLSLSLAGQAAVTVAVLGFLFLLSLFAAQFGWPGMLVFWLVVVVLVR